MSPEQKYQNYLDRPEFLPDRAQAATVGRLDELYRRLCAAPQRGRVARIVDRLSGRPVNPVVGLYLWGGVGRGKTFLMDLFYDCLPFQAKQRMHFHRFMRRVHHELAELAGVGDPLDRVAQRLAAESRVLCFDEFFVSDIGDAMILGELLGGLFQRGVCLVATSNIAPPQLYENGLQRDRFLGAIELLEQHTETVNLDGETDFRLRLLEQAEIYHWPADNAADELLARSFDALAPDPDYVEQHTPIEIEGRLIERRRCGDDVAWFDFAALCDGPRSQNDYIELARIYHAVLISGIPVFTGSMEDQARRFISLVDEFYDRSVKLVVSAAGPVDELYQGQLLGFEFQRTRSRLEEMQSFAYLGRSHRP